MVDFFIDSLIDYNIYPHILSKGATDGSLWSDYGIYLLSNQIIFQFSNNLNNVDNIIFNFNLQENSWYNAAIVFDNGSISLYIDGNLIQSYTTVNTYMRQSNEPLYIGHRYQTNNTGPFYGNLENVHIWNINLSQQEIQEYVNCPPTGNESGLVGYWNFEEGNGATASDQTSNGNDGTINGATYDTNVPSQSCQLTNVNGCDSTAILNLTINQPDTSYTSITACDSYTWNDSTYTQSGTYYSNTASNNNYSMSFDGLDDQVSISSNLLSQSLPSGNNDRSLVFSVMPEYPSANNNGASIISYGLGCSTCINQRFSVFVWDNTWEIVIVGQSNDINTGIFLDFGQWNDIAVVLNNDSLFVYKNGQQLYSTMNIYNTASGTDLFIGSNTQDRLDEFFGGKIDNLHIWDLALTQQEIQQYISCLPSSGETGLVGLGILKRVAVI